MFIKIKPCIILSTFWLSGGAVGSTLTFGVGDLGTIPTALHQSMCP